jgi:transcriptional regulator with PAS, ATPase and Fis domain
MLELLKLVERLRDSTSPVLLLGETGVGKELFARAIHEGGRSRRGEFVFFHPSGRPSNLFESELFGYVKGAFTGADKDTKGLVAEADGGTLFLDEIGEMSEDLQTKLLRLLESGEYRRLGETTVRNADIRIVSATNKDLAGAVKEGTFRKDLFYRLAAVTLEIPPLRERPDDIPALAEYFLAEFSKVEGRRISGISPEVMRVLMAWDWPGNVRELQNEIRRAVALADSDSEITLDLLSPRIITALEGSSVDRPLQQEMEALQRRRILQALSSADWNKNHAAKRLGLKRTTLLAKMKRLGISR